VKPSKRAKPKAATETKTYDPTPLEAEAVAA
jgi:hypothetical protein